LVSRGNLENFKYTGRVKLEWLAQKGENLIILTGCLASELRYLQDGELSRYANFLRANFPHLYAEIQHNHIPEQQGLNERAEWLAREVGIKTVLTGDCHYSRPETRNRWRILNTFDYPDSGDDFSLVATKDEVSCEVADLIEEYSITSKPVLPTISHRVGLRKLVKDRLPKDEVYRERCRYELKVISEMGFEDYFLVLYDVIEWCRTKGILVGPGRGSAAGSLVCYLLGITEVDPIEHGLIFERFLNPSRVSLPDIDVDFQSDRRDEVLEYMATRHGAAYGLSNHVALKARSALKDAARYHDIEPQEANRANKMMPSAKFGVTFSLEDSRELSGEFDAWCAEHEHVYQTALSLEGVIRGRNRHAGGVVIYNGNITDVAPVCIDKDKRPMLEYDLIDAEEAGLVKFDFLGLRALCVIAETMRATGVTEIPNGDANAYRLISLGETFGVFQLESGGITDLCKQVQPSTLGELSDVIALYRPGPMESGMMAQYAANRNLGRASFFPEIDSMLQATRGVVIYQEQVMQICQVMAGYSMAEADAIRKIMGKKKRDAVEAAGLEFVERASQLGRDERACQQMWAALAQFAAYGFNKSHSVAYATITYRTAWLKAHYHTEFMTAVYNSYAGKQERQASCLAACMNEGLTVRRPKWGTTDHAEARVEKDGVIRLGWSSMKGLGAVANKMPTGHKYIMKAVTDKVIDRRIAKALAKGAEFNTSKVSRCDLLAWIDASKTKKLLSSWKAGSLLDPLFAHDVEAFGIVIEPQAIKIHLNQLRAKSGASSLTARSGFVCGVLLRVEKKSTRRGDAFGILWMQDHTGIYDFPMWPDTFARCPEVSPGHTCLMMLDDRGSVLRLQVIPESTPLPVLPRPQ
jgi:DNA polymerase-3 subunit alpha